MRVRARQFPVGSALRGNLHGRDGVDAVLVPAALGDLRRVLVASLHRRAIEICDPHITTPPFWDMCVEKEQMPQASAHSDFNIS